jgi:hypothetical protein
MYMDNNQIRIVVKSVIKSYAIVIPSLDTLARRNLLHRARERENKNMYSLLSRI